MIRLSLNLPTKHRLDLQLVKRRTLAYEKPLVPSLKEIRKIRKGNKGSRFFRHIFEQKRLRKLLGTNLAVALIVTSFYPANAKGFETQAENTVVSEIEKPLLTERVTQYPVQKPVISQGFSIFHPALDIDGVTGDPIYPIKNGVVENTIYSNFALGNTVSIRHNSGLTSLYAHLSEIDVEKGQEVDTNTKIGEMGTSGRAFGDHLHLEVRKDGKIINPSSILLR